MKGPRGGTHPTLDRGPLMATALDSRPLVNARREEELRARLAKGHGALLATVGVRELHRALRHDRQHEIALLHAWGPGSGHRFALLDLADLVPRGGRRPDGAVLSDEALRVPRADHDGCALLLVGALAVPILIDCPSCSPAGTGGTLRVHLRGLPVEVRIEWVPPLHIRCVKALGRREDADALADRVRNELGQVPGALPRLPRSLTTVQKEGAVPVHLSAQLPQEAGAHLIFAQGASAASVAVQEVALDRPALLYRDHRVPFNNHRRAERHDLRPLLQVACDGPRVRVLEDANFLCRRASVRLLDGSGAITPTERLWTAMASEPNHHERIVMVLVQVLFSLLDAPGLDNRHRARVLRPF
mmetsp:Transcript_30937/g.96248  ORF Transcript_30937/g.96248 Transcript_30937/m.96248 type:complete len:359 (-) Transcript_30937:493-1569(-)